MKTKDPLLVSLRANMRVLRSQKMDLAITNTDEKTIGWVWYFDVALGTAHSLAANVKKRSRMENLSDELGQR